MKYAGVVARTVRLTVRNPFAVVLVSVAATLSTVPFVTGLIVGGPVGGLVGLWTSSILLGLVCVGGARSAVVLHEREVSLGTDYFREGLRRGPVLGFAVGVGTFCVILLLVLLWSVRADTLLDLALVMVGLYVFVAWVVLVVFSTSLWAGGEFPGVRTSFRAGAVSILENPVAAAWVVVQAVGWTLLAIPLVVAPALLLPGFVQLLGTGFVLEATSDDA